jgi:hypothetical protein
MTIRQSRLFLLVVSALALACLSLPAAASAGTYKWSLPGDFTAAGANPDHDGYGGTPWHYLDGTAPTALSPLGTFEASSQGGLSGWTDAGDTSTFVGVNPQPQSVTGGFQNEDTFAAGQMVLEPTPQHLVAIRWVSPLSATIAVSATLVSDETSSPADKGCAAAGWDTWELDLNGAAVPGKNGTVPTSASGPQPISASLTVRPGDEVDLVIAAGMSASGDSACAPVGATLQVQAPVSPPAVTVDGPSPGAEITDGEPIFSGTAEATFGDVGTVTVRVYRGTAVDPTALVQTLTTTRAGATYSVAPDPFLYDDTYTVQAEQNNILGDHGFSAAVTFKVADPLPPIALDPLGSRPLVTRTPTLNGMAGTIAGDSDLIEVLVWTGAHVHGYPMRSLVASRGLDGRWSVQVTPPLEDGQYLAIAAQDGPAGLIGSQFDLFRIKVDPPAVTLDRTRVSGRTITLAGRAGVALGDAPSVSVFLYRGPSARGRPRRSFEVRERHGRWTLRWRGGLAAGLYTVRALQRDDAGHVASTASRHLSVS